MRLRQLRDCYKWKRLSQRLLVSHIATVEKFDYKDTSGIATKTVEDISKFSQKKVQSLVHDKFYLQRKWDMDLECFQL